MRSLLQPVKSHAARLGVRNLGTETPKSIYAIAAKLPPILEKQKHAVKEQTRSTVRKALANTISSSLTKETGSFDGKSKNKIFDITLAAVIATADSPIHIRLDKNGLFTNYEIFRQLGLNTYEIIGTIKRWVNEGLPITESLIADAFTNIHAFSHTKVSSELLDIFNKNNPGAHQAYDLAKIREVYEKTKDTQLTHDDYGNLTAEEKIFWSWIEHSSKMPTQKEVAIDMFNKENFSIPSDRDGIIKYSLGVWAGSLATSLSKTIVGASEGGRFFGCKQGTGWVISRMAVFDVSSSPFWMENDRGNITRNALIENYALQTLYASAKLLEPHKSIQGNPEYYFAKVSDVRGSIAKALKETFHESIEVGKLVGQKNTSRARDE